MASNKKYYWLKLKENFFTSKEMKKLRKIAGGDTYVIIYLKMQLLSIKNEGKIYFDGIEDDFASEIALTLDEDVENVQITLAYLIKSRLLECVSDDEFYLPQVVENTGKEGDSAERVRRHRALQCNADVTKCNTEIEKELELEKELDTELELDKVSDRSKTSKKFIKPTVEEIKTYCNERGNDINPEQFFDYYESTGWLVGKKQMKDWKASVRTWEKNKKEKNNNGEIKQPVINKYNAGMYEGII